MAKFWWSVIKSQPRSQSESDELLKSDGLKCSISTIALRSSHELHFLEPYTDFLVQHDKSREFCSCNSYYEISSQCNKLSLSGIQNHDCCWIQDPFDNLQLVDDKNRPILKISKTEFSGYLSTKMRFRISATSGHKIGEVLKISEFLERPKYEIHDLHGDSAFLMLVCHTNHGSNDSRIKNQTNHFVTGKMGRMAHIKEENSMIYLEIKQNVSVIEKALLLSLVLILDFSRRAE